MLGLSLHSWEDLMILALAIVGAFGVLVGVATFAVVRLQRAELAASKTEFDAYKLEAGTQIAKAHENTAALQQEAAEARLETERLKKEFSWRDLSNEQQRAITAVLAKKPMQITIGWTSGDPESAYFARYLAQVFLAAGSQISAFAPFGLLGEQQFGLQVSGSETEELRVLVEALKAASVGEITVKQDQRKPDGSKYFTHVFVGFRAPPLAPK